MTEPITYRELLRLNDEEWAKLPADLRGFPVYYRWYAGQVQLWPKPFNWLSISLGVRYK